MTQSFSNKEGVFIVRALIQIIQDNKQYLSDIDGQIGDGDHGINMNKGFTLCAEKLDTLPDADFSQALKELSNILMMKIGGSMGPLYGFFFKSLADQSAGHVQIDQALFQTMFESVPSNLSKITKAKPGDKTLMDCLIPAVEAFSQSAALGNDFSTSLSAMKEAAIQGGDSTKDLISKVGRSSRLGERSKGVIDAGSASCCLIICTLADSIQSLFAKEVA